MDQAIFRNYIRMYTYMYVITICQKRGHEFEEESEEGICEDLKGKEDGRNAVIKLQYEEIQIK